MLTDRIDSLDVVRGIAVMGILLVNVVSFAMPEAAYINPQAWGGTSPADLTAWTVVQLFFEGRMRGLFALLFGASATLVLDRAAAAERSPTATHLARMGTLALFGAVHLFLIWPGDILLHYAIVGAALPLFRHLPPRTLATFAAAAFALQCLWWTVTIGGIMAWRHAAGLPGAAPALVRDFAAAYAALPGPNNPSIAAELAAYRGGFLDAAAYRWHADAGLPITFLVSFGGETLGSMLLGMALFRAGFFSRWSGTALRRVAVAGLVLAMPAFVAMTWWSVASGFDRLVLMGNFIAWVIPFRVAGTLAYAALAVLAAARWRSTALVRRVAAAGRMAFTNYLLTSLLMTGFFNGWGLGFYGYFGRAESYLLVPVIWALMLLWSAPWLARFHYGPLEWLWRSLARRSWQPIRR